MALEIERKFLVIGNDWKNLAKGILYRQGYLNVNKNRTVRVRIIDQKSILTIKGKSICIVYRCKIRSSKLSEICGTSK